MTRKKILPIPLILLIPIVLLVAVVVAGIYRFSLSDAEIMAKFPQAEAQSDPIVLEVLGLSSRNPWTIQVPEQGAVAFLDKWDRESGYLTGHYDAGSTKGQVMVPTKFIAKREINHVPWIVAPVVVTTQGTGAFYYIGLFKFDAVPSRVVLLNNYFIGDRIKITSLDWRDDGQIDVTYLTHSHMQPVSQHPELLKSVALRNVGNSLHMQQE